MASDPMRAAALNCPACGAPVELAHRFVKMVVCAHCGNTLAVHDDRLDPTGKSAALADLRTRFRVGQQGAVRGRPFRILGRVRFATDDEAVEQMIPDVAAVLAWDPRRRWLERLGADARNLRWLQSSSDGIDHVLVPSLVARDDVMVTNARGIFDGSGRMMVLMTHNTNIGDSWEEEASNPQYFYEFSTKGYAFGINAVIYAMTH